MYLNDLVFTLKNIDVCNFADKRTPYVCNKSLDKLLGLVAENTELALCWFENKYMQLNTDKCHLIVSRYKHEQLLVQVERDKIWENADLKRFSVNWNLISMSPRFALNQAEN